MAPGTRWLSGSPPQLLSEPQSLRRVPRRVDAHGSLLGRWPAPRALVCGPVASPAPSRRHGCTQRSLGRLDLERAHRGVGQPQRVQLPSREARGLAAALRAGPVLAPGVCSARGAGCRGYGPGEAGGRLAPTRSRTGRSRDQSRAGDASHRPAPADQSFLVTCRGRGPHPSRAARGVWAGACL
ncbi:hypothetical protein DyAD56_20205 [Dyella sp. AD56]|nr:hypothetical protein DyAD56_20205 [Dyella sp. AD56]